MCGPQVGPVVEPDALTLGAEVAVQTSTVGVEGGTVVVSDPGGPLDGMTIEVPAGAYAGTTNWAVSYRPIVESRLGENVQPLTPLISLEGVEGYAEDLIQVRVPVAVPTDRAYDRSTMAHLPEGSDSLLPRNRTSPHPEIR